MSLDGLRDMKDKPVRFSRLYRKRQRFIGDGYCFFLAGHIDHYFKKISLQHRPISSPGHERRAPGLHETSAGAHSAGNP